MQSDRWQRIKEILDVSLRLEPAERAQYLSRVCEGDAAMREEVESLIDAHDEAGDLFDTPALADVRDPMLGARLGPYQIVDELGSGGMGSVYLATRADEVFHKTVAIKVVRRGLDLDYVVRHFRMERQIMASLEHPHIASLLDGGTTPDGLPYFVMEFIRGKSIDAYCNENALGIGQRLKIFRQVCAAVEFAHQRGIVHRDIKPSNILVTAEGVPKLLDFGIAKILQPEMLPTGDSIVTIGPAMTPDYASPEQLMRQPVSPASDVFSLGVVLCELLSGSRPHAQRTPFRPQTTDTGTPRLPSRLSGRRELAGDLDAIVLKAVQEDSARRYGSAGRLGEDIQRYLDGLPVLARRHGPVYRFSKFLRRQRPAVASVIVTLAIAGLVFTISRLRERLSESSEPPQILQLTSVPGQETQPAVSPDGKKLAFVWTPEEGGKSEIYAQNLSGGPMERVSSDHGIDLSPAWAPDGSRIGWLHMTNNQAAIVSVLPAGGPLRKIADVFPARLDVVGRHLDWSPDGGWIATTDKNSPEQPFRIVRIRTEDGSKRDVTVPPEQIIGDVSPAFSHDGKWLSFLRAVSSGVNDIYVVPAGGGPPQRVTFDNRYITALAWTPDNRGIVFSSERGGVAALWRVPATGGTPSRLPLAGPNASDPTFSRDGRKLVYSQVSEDANIWRQDASGEGRPVKLISSTQYDSSPQYSPDGSRIAFRSNRSGSHEIWVANSDGRNPTQITHFGGTLTGTPHWSPDGKEIAFDSRPEGQPDIYTIPAGGGKERRVTSDQSEDVVPSWSRDGRWIYFASNRSGVWQVWRTPISGGPAQQITTSGGFAAAESTDGAYLYYAKGRDVRGLWRKRLPNGAEAEVLENLQPGFWGYWSVVQAGIYFVDQAGPGGLSRINFYDFAGKKTKPIARLEKPPLVGDSAFAVSPDGKFLLYTQLDQSGSDILALDHYRP